LPLGQRNALAAAYREKFDATVRARLEQLRRDANTRPEEFYSLAPHYRFSAAGAAGYALAADRLLELGDLSAGFALYQLALRGGWVPDDARAARIELLRRFDEGKALAPSPEATTAPATRSSIPSAGPTRLAAAYTGPLPFDAPWFDAVATVGQARPFPFAADDRIYFAGRRRLLQSSRAGRWRGRSCRPPPRRRAGRRRSAIASKAAVCPPATPR